MDTSTMPVAKPDTKHTFTEPTPPPLVLDLAEVWEDMTGEFFSECNYWVARSMFFGHDKTQPAWRKEAWTPSYKVALIHETENGTLGHTWLTAEDFARAYCKLVRDGWTHCGGCGIDDPDSCVQDAVVQTAIFDDIIFG